MANLTGEERSRYVQGMFSRIAHRYDLMNRLMTFGQDLRWRREVLRRAELSPGSQLLDIGTGTGDLALEALRRNPGLTSVAADFTIEMMRVGQGRHGGNQLNWCASDALNLPYVSSSFDAVISGFLFRNVSDLPRVLSEHIRILKPGGRIVILDTTRPPDNFLSPLITFHLNTIIPTLGGLIAGNSEAYTYLPDSTTGFLRAEALAVRMVNAGFQKVSFRRVMFGTVAIHWGRRP